MSNPSKRKGDKAEREIAGILADQLGVPMRRKLGAGRTDDTGDIDGLPDVTIEVKSYADVARAVRDGLDDCAREQANAGTVHGATFVRRPGGRWFVALTVEQWCAMYRETLS
jgi:hypothetical protein